MAFKESDLVHPTLYTIHVGGLLNPAWAAWLNGMLLELEPQVDLTAIIVAVPDQSALRGILNRLWDLNLTLISVNRIQEEQDA